MARLKNGVNGGFSGTVGSVVGSNWRGLDYMRSKPKHSAKRPTAKQLITRERFKKLSEFLSFFDKALSIGLNTQDLKGMTAYNLAVRLNKEAFWKTREDEGIDFSRIVLTKGGAVARPGNCSGRWTNESKLHVQWEIFGQSPIERPSDKVVLAVYCDELAEFVSDIGNLIRADKEAWVWLPDSWSDSPVYVYMFMVSLQGRCSETVFVGSFKQDRNG